MTDDAAAELRALRARAYGPDADILRDPVAYDRLQELEEQLRSEQRAPERSGGVGDAPPATPVDGEGATSSASTAPSTDGTESSSAAAPSSDDRGSRSGERAPWSPLTRVPPLARVFWGASVLAAAALAGSVTWGFASIPVISEGSGARQIAALDAVQSVDLPPFSGDPETPSTAFQFAGYTLMTVVNSTDDIDSECLVAFSSENVDEESGFPNGPTYYGCGAGAFPPAASVPIHAGSPAEARERFGEGAALQFVLQDDRVGVFIDSAPGRPVS